MCYPTQQWHRLRIQKTESKRSTIGCKGCSMIIALICAFLRLNTQNGKYDVMRRRGCAIKRLKISILSIDTDWPFIELQLNPKAFPWTLCFVAKYELYEHRKTNFLTRCFLKGDIAKTFNSSLIFGRNIWSACLANRDVTLMPSVAGGCILYKFCQCNSSLSKADANGIRWPHFADKVWLSFTISSAVLVSRTSGMRAQRL